MPRTISMPYDTYLSDIEDAKKAGASDSDKFGKKLDEAIKLLNGGYCSREDLSKAIYNIDQVRKGLK